MNKIFILSGNKNKLIKFDRIVYLQYCGFCKKEEYFYIEDYNLPEYIPFNNVGKITLECLACESEQTIDFKLNISLEIL